MRLLSSREGELQQSIYKDCTEPALLEARGQVPGRSRICQHPPVEQHERRLLALRAQSLRQHGSQTPQQRRLSSQAPRDLTVTHSTSTSSGSALSQSSHLPSPTPRRALCLPKCWLPLPQTQEPPLCAPFPPLSLPCCSGWQESLAFTSCRASILEPCPGRVLLSGAESSGHPRSRSGICALGIQDPLSFRVAGTFTLPLFRETDFWPPNGALHFE